MRQISVKSLSSFGGHGWGLCARPSRPGQPDSRSWHGLLEPGGFGADESDVGRDEQHSTDDGNEPALRCVRCDAVLARTGAACDPDGRGHRQVHANPAGYLFEIVCFERAPGVSEVGVSSEAFTWFAGYAWIVAVCGSCHTHVGWRFHSDTAAFVGLISERVH